MFDFEKYFSLNQDLLLKQIDYKSIEVHDSPETAKLVCKDELEILKIDEEKIDLIFTRKLNFEPKCLYELTISFGFSLVFNQNNKLEVDWNKIDFVKELKDDQNVVLGNIISRVSLLISEITSCNGFIPIITPPSFMS
ncbi:MAG: hypothetical protein GX129_05340 [Clostridiales bacterium]|jgi:hypothetical protein|nr:hypothetical protein [Clostridiales bacterium]